MQYKQDIGPFSDNPKLILEKQTIFTISASIENDFK